MAKRSRRRLLQVAGLAVGLLARLRAARAQTYPARPVRLIVGFPRGGPNDILARLMAQWLSGRLGQAFQVENRPGASGNIATLAVARAPPDGYTLLLVGPANAINSLREDLDIDFMRDIVPVAGITREPLVMVVHPSVPAGTVSELMAYAKAHPGAVKMGSTGSGSAPHVSGELFKMMTGVDFAVVQYAGGGPALEALLGAQVQVMLEPISAAIHSIRAGTLRALAVTTATRCELLPDIPTMGESVPGYEVSAVTGIGAPKNISAEIVATLNKEVNAAFADPEMKTRLARTCGTPLAGSPAEFARLMVAEAEKWAKVVKFSGSRSD
jgi:tripartite-type tricarboxylate transporter receptor subunit TctC